MAVPAHSPLDLQKLKIDRGPARAHRRRGLPGWLIPLLLLAGAGWIFRAPLVRSLDRVRLPLVEVVQAQKADALAAGAISGTAANGYIVARSRAALSADAPGRVVEIRVEEGSVVQKGEIVARLYSEEFEASLRNAEAEIDLARAGVVSAEARLAEVRREVPVLEALAAAAGAQVERATAGVELADRELKRIEELEAKDVQSASQLDQARTTARQAQSDRDAVEANLLAARGSVESGRSAIVTNEAALAEARAQVPVSEARRDQARAILDKTFVRAPFDGVVVLKDAEVGEVVSPNSLGSNSRGSVVTMVDFASLEVQVELPETSISAVRVGAPVRIFLDAYPDRPYTGSVRRIWPTANRQKATIEVRVGFESPDQHLRPEMGVRVVFRDSQEDFEDPRLVQPPRGIILPEACLVREEGGSGLFVLERDVARWRAVEAGERRGGRVHILAGVEAGELVVLNPPSVLGDGDRVRYER